MPHESRKKETHKWGIVFLCKPLWWLILLNNRVSHCAPRAVFKLVVFSRQEQLRFMLLN